MKHYNASQYQTRLPLYNGFILEHDGVLYEWNGRAWQDENGELIADLGLCARLKFLAAQSLMGLAG